jgi:transposase
MDKGSLELLLAQGLSVERIAKRFGKHPSTVSYWLAKHGLEAVGHETHSAKGGVSRERLEALVEAGMTVAELAEALNLGGATVRFWLRRYGLRTLASRRVDAVHGARESGQLTATLTCAQHGETDFILEGRGYYRCKRCRQDRVAQRRRTLKQILVANAGEKRLAISANRVTLSLAALRAEAQKCVLVCSNCHAELEGGVAKLPDRVTLADGPGNTP